jgi:hypothetical protein
VRREKLIAEYGKQIKAFFHFAFKHLFEVEFAIRVFVEVLLFLALVYIVLKVLHIILKKARIAVCFLDSELIIPLRVRLFEKLAFTTNNPNWQERANKIKDAFKERNMEHKENAVKENTVKKKSVKKSCLGWWVFIYIFLVVWIIGFHYFGEEKRNNYEVFFLGENAILGFEERFTYTLLETDEFTTECFFHNQIEIDWKEIFNKDN